MSRNSFYVVLARLSSDPDTVRAMRRGDESCLQDLDLDAREIERLRIMAADPRMAVMCSLYRSNRLTALLHTVPEIVVALGTELSDILSDFWREQPHGDMQFRSEADAFCDFVRRRYADDPGLLAVVDTAETEMRSRYDVALSSGPVDSDAAAR